MSHQCHGDSTHGHILRIGSSISGFNAVGGVEGASRGCGRPEKRPVPFVRAIAAAAAQEPRITGLSAGYDPERERVEKAMAETCSPRLVTLGRSAHHKHSQVRSQQTRCCSRGWNGGAADRRAMRTLVSISAPRPRWSLTEPHAALPSLKARRELSALSSEACPGSTPRGFSRLGSRRRGAT